MRSRQRAIWCAPPINPHLLLRATRIERSVAARHHTGRSVIGFNRMLEKHAKDGSYDIVFVDKGVWVRPETLLKLKKAARKQIAIHYTPDAQFFENCSRHFFSGLPEYNLCVTTKPFELDQYTGAGAREVKLIQQGYGARLRPTRSAEIPDSLKSDVCFIGHCQPHYAAFLEKFARQIPLKIRGPRWTAFARKNNWARGVVQGEGCYGDDYTRALSGAKIAIGLLSKRIPETTTTRSFEIPACGTMLLAERTDDHLALFEEGREAAFFDDVSECIEKATYYLENGAELDAIAAAGRKRCLRSNYSVEGQFESIVEWIELAANGAA